MVEMAERMATLRAELREVEARLADPDLHADQTSATATLKRHKHLAEIVATADTLDQATDDLGVAREMRRETTGTDDVALLDAEIDELEATVADATERLQLLLLPRDPNDDRNVIVEIRGAAGGEEANLFARDLYEMYIAFARRQQWSTELLGAQPSDMGGFTDVIFLVKGDRVWTRMKFEGGTHRVQRVPVTESQGRIHTSSAAVIVLPEAEEVEVVIEDKDLQIDYFRASGPGGQSVNTTDSAVRVTHVPTGVAVSMQDEKSQLQNREKAMRVLRARLLQQQREQHEAQQSEARRSQVGSADRSEKIRTYNFKENRVTDHRIGLTVHKLDKVLAGELDDVSDALVHDEQQRRLSGDAG
ncbi:MAG: peptide chain release factor 1 [Acidimicrobiia bacterium]|nr:peptide chain release factor 1 [Acidimicrobiia bacterium]